MCKMFNMKNITETALLSFIKFSAIQCNMHHHDPIVTIRLQYMYMYYQRRLADIIRSEARGTSFLNTYSINVLLHNYITSQISYGLATASQQ